MYRTALQETHFSRQRERGGVIRAGASSYLCMQQYVCCRQSLHTDSRLLDVQHSLLYVTLNITVILRSKQTLTLMFLLTSFIVTGSIPPATAVVYLSIGIPSQDNIPGMVWEGLFWVVSIHHWWRQDTKTLSLNLTQKRVRSRMGPVLLIFCFAFLFLDSPRAALLESPFKIILLWFILSVSAGVLAPPLSVNFLLVGV